MKSISASEARTHFARLLDRVSKGERITIERYGVPAAVLQPPEMSKRRPAAEVITELRQFRAKHRLDGLSIREMRNHRWR